MIHMPYNEARKNMLSGDTILWKSHTALGWIIRVCSGADTNHDSLVTTPYGVDRVLISEALEDGIEVHSLSRRIEKFKGEVYWLPLKNEYDRCRHSIMNWALEHIDVGYDYSSLFKQTHKRVKADGKRLFCSEFDFMAKRDGGKIECLQGMEIAPRPGDMESLGIYNERVRIK